MERKNWKKKRWERRKCKIKKSRGGCELGRGSWAAGSLLKGHGSGSGNEARQAVWHLCWTLLKCAQVVLTAVWLNLPDPQWLTIMAANEEVTFDQRQPLMRHSASIQDHDNRGTEVMQRSGVSSLYISHPYKLESFSNTVNQEDTSGHWEQRGLTIAK